MDAGGVVLTGGRSTRMGAPKAWLDWRGSTLLATTCAVLLGAVDGPVLVVRSPGQSLPPLPATVEVYEDPQEGLGPVQGLAVGLRMLAGRADIAFACSTDLPFLDGSFVRCVLRELRQNPDAETVVPVAGGRAHPLAAAYRSSLAGPAEAAVASGELRLLTFLAARRVRHLGSDELLRDPEVAASDPSLLSVTNVNDQRDYARALRVSRG